MKRFPAGLACVLAVYLLTLCLVSPLYEYPIGDDWAYSKVAEHFYQTHHFEILPWYGQSLIFQIAWAFLFLVPFGFSFSALHLSNVVMGGIAILFFYFLLRRLGFKEKESSWGALLFLASPPFIFTTRTFYTEPSFMAMYLGGAWAYAEGLRKRSMAWFWLGGIFLSFALLVRQVGVFLPIFLLWILRDSKKWSFSHRLGALFPLGTLFLFTIWQHWVLQKVPPANLLIALYGVRLDQVVSEAIRMPFFALFYFGYVLSPLLVPAAVSLCAKNSAATDRRRLFILSGVGFGIVSVAFGLGSRLWMSEYFTRGFTLNGAPAWLHAFVILLGIAGASLLSAFYFPLLVRHIPQRRFLWGWGLCFGILLILFLPPIQSVLLRFGALFLSCIYNFFAPRIHLYHSLGTWQEKLPALYHKMLFELLVIFCIALSPFYVIPLFLKKKKELLLFEKMEPAEKVLHGGSVLYLFFLLGIPFVTIDRYLFPIFPSTILLTLRIVRLLPYRRGITVFLVLCVLAMSLLHTDRIIQRVGALWEGGQRLRQGVPVEKIDAGFVFNGWYHYERQLKEGAQGIDRDWRRTGWWVADSEYRATTELPKGNEVIGTVPYRDLLTPGPHQVYLTQRSPGRHSEGTSEGREGTP